MEYLSCGLFCQECYVMLFCYSLYAIRTDLMRAARANIMAEYSSPISRDHPHPAAA